MKRREAISKIVLSAGPLILLPAAFVSCEKSDPDPDPATTTDNGETKDFTIDLSDTQNAALNSEGGYKVTGGYIVINTGNNTFTALSSACTHSGCTVDYSQSNNNLPCPCHGSVFALNGSVLNGPASTNLTVYNVTKDENILTIK